LTQGVVGRDLGGGKNDGPEDGGDVNEDDDLEKNYTSW